MKEKKEDEKGEDKKDGKEDEDKGKKKDEKKKTDDGSKDGMEVLKKYFNGKDSKKRTKVFLKFVQLLTDGADAGDKDKKDGKEAAKKDDKAKADGKEKKDKKAAPESEV